MANDLGLEGPTKPLKLQWTNNQVKEQLDSKIVSVTVQGKNNKRYTLRRVKTISGLALPIQSVDVQAMQKTFPFMENFSDLSYRNGKPKLLIGQDNWPVIVSRKIAYGDYNGPVISKTLLGWVVHGNLNTTEKQDQLTDERVMLHIRLFKRHE